jgi:predicted CopG family antitoxin
MAKRTAATWIDKDLYARLERVAKVDRRSVAEVIAMAVERGLPAIERHIDDAPVEEILREKPEPAAATGPGKVRKQG